jgi:hypothetical protein
MPIKYKIFQDKKLVYALGVGDITYDDLVLHIEELASEPKYIPPMKKLVDYRNANLSTLSTEDSTKITKKKALLIDNFTNEKCAFVTKRDLEFGMLRFHEAQIDGSGIITNVFRNLEDALVWLQVKLDENEMDLG